MMYDYYVYFKCKYSFIIIMTLIRRVLISRFFAKPNMYVFLFAYFLHYRSAPLRNTLNKEMHKFELDLPHSLLEMCATIGQRCSAEITGNTPEGNK